MRMMKPAAGFTLVELMATTAIFSVLMTLAVPAFVQWLPGYRLKWAARDLYSQFAAAKMTAVNQKGECAVVFSATEQRYQIWSGGNNKIYDNGSGDDVLLKTVELTGYGSGVRYGKGSADSPIGASFDDGITFSSNRAVFDSGGMVKSLTGGYVYLQNDRNACYAVGALGSGVILLKRWMGTDWQ
jgi:prepilin-type N-terminal cleavage/methylation domain-containing protein